MLQLPAQLTAADDDLVRSRLTVFFRLLLALPHLVWLYLWGRAAQIVAFFTWIAALFLGRLPHWAHGFFSSYVRYQLHVYSYLSIAGGPYPGFIGEPGSYPIDAEIVDGPERQNRWTILFRLILAIPTLLLAAALGLAAFIVGVLAWFAALFTGRMPQGFRNALIYALNYMTQANAYCYLVSPRYPNSDTAAAPLDEAPAHPVRLTVGGDLERSRLTVFFRYLLTLPHLVWLTLWGVVAEVAALIGWVVALFTGHLPDPFHRFIRAYVRYQAHVSAYLYLAANPFPGFTGAPGTYPVEVEVPDRERQPRLVILLRLFLSLPAFLVATALGYVQLAAGVLAWWAALFTGRMPAGLRSAITYAIGYTAQTYSYALLLTVSYPYSGPPGAASERPEAAPSVPAAL